MFGTNGFSSSASGLVDGVDLPLATIVLLHREKSRAKVSHPSFLVLGKHRTVVERASTEPFFQRTFTRYLFALLTVAAAVAIRLLLSPFTGTGAPFVLFFGATLVTSLLAGTGPGALALATSLAVAAYLFVVRAGNTASQAAFQSLLYAADGGVILYLTSLTNRRLQTLDDTNHKLRRMTEEAAQSEAHARAVIELAPDAFFQADLDARLTDVNQAACRLLGYQRSELIGKTIFDIIPPEDAERLKRVRDELLVPGKISKSEWTQNRKDGVPLTVEVSSKILPDGRWQAFVRDITARKRIEDQRQVFVSLLDNSVDFIGIADPAGTPIYVNAAGRRMTGLAPDVPVERLQIQDFYPPELGGFVTDVILRTMRDRGVWFGETFFQNFKTHEHIPVSDTHFMIRDASGERILGMGTVTRDISEARGVAREREQLLARERQARQEAETANEQLRESEERFRLTVDEAPIGMALVALDGRFVRVNRVLCEITGYAANELTKLRFQDITHPDDVDADVSIARRLARGEIPRYQFEKRYIRKDGSVVVAMLSVSVLRDPNGAARYYISRMEDITERKRAEVSMRLSEAKFSGIVSIAADAIISVDKDQRITVFNEGAEKIFGYARKDMIGTQLERLIPERLRAKHQEDFARFAAGDQVARTMGDRREVYGLRKNGEEFPADASISKVAVGDATFFSVVLRDITYRKNVERALQRAVAARDDVLRIVAHDLRNPLGTIVMQASAMERAGPEPERRDPQVRHMITRAATRMNQLIQDLLDVALLEGGQFKVEHTRLSPAALVREAVDLQAILAAASELELTADVPDDVPDIWGDRKRLLQVFENLIGNAIKFTTAGGRIVVAAARKGDDVVFSVSDTGAGIAPEAMAHVFDRFWQATTSAKRLGAGLGLPITKGIVEAHGGRIWVESHVGRGSTFSFAIPVAARAAAA
jgi:PAS domain S-box-containing protein